MRARSQGRGTQLRVQQSVKTPAPPSSLNSLPSPVTTSGKGSAAMRLPMIANSPSPAAPSSLFASLYDDSPIGPSLLSQTIAQSRSGSGGGTRTQTNPNAQAASVSHAVGVCSQQGRRPYQEDEFSIRPFLSPTHAGSSSSSPTHFFGLFDGHAGGRCSQHLAAQLALTLAEDALFESDLPAALKRSFHSVNEQFLRFAEKNKLHDGSTGLCVVVRDNRITVANVGDCRAVLVSMGGTARAPSVQVTQLSNDHKPTNIDEQKRILSLGGCVVNCMGVARVNRVLAVSRAFGNRTLRTVIRPDAELTQREMGPQDEFLIMASDGLWDVLRNKEVGDVCAAVLFSPTQLSQTQRAQRIAEELVSLALNRGSMDNVTCIALALSTDLFRCTSSPTPSPAAAVSSAVFAGEKAKERAASASSPRNIAVSSINGPNNVSGNTASEEVRQFRRQMEHTLQGSTLGNNAANNMNTGVNGNLYGSLHNYGNLQGIYVNGNSEGESERAFLSSSLPPRSSANGPPPVTRTPSLSHIDPRPLTVDSDRGRGGPLLSNTLPSRPASQSGRAASTQRERERERERERLRARDF